MNPLYQLGMLLRRERVAAGWSQIDLAEKAGIRRQMVSSLEIGDVLQPQRMLDLLWLCQASIMVMQQADQLARWVARERWR